MRIDSVGKRDVRREMDKGEQTCAADAPAVEKPRNTQIRNPLEIELKVVFKLFFSCP